MVVLSSSDSPSLTDNHGFYTTAVFILFFLSLIIALENLLVLVSVGMFTSKKYSINPFICSLSLADILWFLGPVLISLHVYTSDKSQGIQQHSSLCRIQSWLLVFLHMESLLSIFMLTMDRILSLTKPTFYSRKWKGWLLVVVVIASWMSSAFISSWQILEPVKPTCFSTHIYCLFTPNSNFAIMFASVCVSFISMCIVSVIYTATSSRHSLFRAEYSSSTGKIKVEKTRNLVQEEYTRKMTRMVSIVASLFYISRLPWMVTIFLGYFNVHYPQIYGLLSLQIPMVSGLCNPLLYGLVWPPFRSAYVNALKAPLRMCNRDSRSFHSHKNQDSSLSRSYSFWSAEGFNTTTADQKTRENSLQILFGPSSHSNKPIDFMPDELRIFENEGLTTDTISLEVDTSDVTIGNDDVTNGKEMNTAATNVALDNSAHFQSILDLIEEMTEGKARGNFSSKREIPKSIDSKDGSDYWSADNGSTQPPSQPCDVSGVDRQAIRSGYAGCICIGKSKCYVVDKNRNRFQKYMVAREAREASESIHEGMLKDVK